MWVSAGSAEAAPQDFSTLVTDVGYMVRRLGGHEGEVRGKINHPPALGLLIAGPALSPQPSRLLALASCSKLFRSN